MRRHIVTHGWLDSARTVVVYHGSQPPPDQIQAEPPYPFPYLVSVTAFRRYKRLIELVEGFAQAIAAMPGCDWRLIIAGPEHDQRYAHEVRARIEQLALADRVIITGGLPRARIWGLLRGALAFVQSSACEVFPQPLLESMAAGTPIVCSRIPPALEIVNDAALMFDPDHPAELASALIHLQDAALRLDLSARGHARFATFGSWAQTAERTRAVLADAQAEFRRKGL